MAGTPESNFPLPFSESENDSLRDTYQPCIEIYPGWSLGYVDHEYISLFSPRGLELTLPGGENDADDWQNITDEQRESVREDEIEARVIFGCIQSIRRELQEIIDSNSSERE